jgi:hypothetical protein
LLKDIKEDQLMAINGYESESEEGYESEEEEGGAKGDGVFIEEEAKKKCCSIKQMIGIIFAIIALGAIGLNFHPTLCFLSAFCLSVTLFVCLLACHSVCLSASVRIASLSLRLFHSCSL